jgi:transcription elongation factor Elf1
MSMAPYHYTRRQWWPLCPMCVSRETIDVDSTEQGGLFCCQECGHTWRAEQPALLQSVGDDARLDSPAQVRTTIRHPQSGTTVGSPQSEHRIAPDARFKN